MTEESKSTFVKIILPKNMKKNWEEFTEREEYPSTSQMIRNAVNEFIRNNNKQDNNHKELRHKQEQLDQTERERDELVQLHKELIEQMKELNKSNIDSKSEVDKHKVKNKIINMLRKASFSSDELSNIIDLPESETLIYLNEMQEFGIITFNVDKMEYEIKRE
nr:MAG: hypothetical protein [uncultured archaeon]